MLCDDADHDPRVNRESCRHMGIASFAVMPVVRGDEVVGIFQLFGNTPHLFKERDILALQRMGEMVNTALDQVDLSRRKSMPSGAAGQGSGPSSGTQVDEEEDDVLCVDDDPIAVRQESPVLPVPAPAVPRTATETVRPIPALSPVRVQRPVQRSNAVHSCVSFGFPVSPGRTLCLDCESAQENQFVSSSGAGVPGFLGGLGNEPETEPGVLAWIRTHKYLLGTIAVVGSTLAILIFR
jgi:hypothetical protein